MAEVSPVAKRFGKFTFFCDFGNSEGQNYSKTCAFYFVGPQKHENISKIFELVPLAGSGSFE